MFFDICRLLKCDERRLHFIYQMLHSIVQIPLAGKLLLVSLQTSDCCLFSFLMCIICTLVVMGAKRRDFFIVPLKLTAGIVLRSPIMITPSQCPSS
jgi:hypothetical protein